MLFRFGVRKAGFFWQYLLVSVIFSPFTATYTKFFSKMLDFYATLIV